VKILLVEDDESLIDLLSKTFSAHNFVVDAVRDGEVGWNYGSTFEYDTIVLDITIPKLDGISLCQRFREEGIVTPILLLTAEETSTVKVRGLDAGADDYVVKPFDISELLARIRALLRRGNNNPLPILTWGDLLLNPSTCEVTYGDRPLSLTTKEYELLELFLRDSQYVFSAEEILDRLWSSEEFPAEATVRSHLRRLRHKLTEAGAPTDFIGTMRGRGYYLKATTQSDLSTAFSPSNLQTEEQLQYLKFLNETWKTTKLQSLEQLTILNRAIEDLYAGVFDLQSQQQVRHIAHKLVGTLGIFGLNLGMQLARELEQLTTGDELLQSQHITRVEKIVKTLSQNIEQTSIIKSSNLPCQQSQQLLVLNTQCDCAQSLIKIATDRGIQSIVTSDLDSVKTWLASQSTTGCTNQSSYGMIMQLPDRSSKERKTMLQWLQELTQNYPTLPILVIGDCNDLSERLAIVKGGGKLLLDSSATPEEAIASILPLLKNPGGEIKVAIVDDDCDWLKILPKLLEPWNFKITTLADPQQFWTVIQTVKPDALVLDINMPAIDGFELCQILRSDPHWQRLPVLFVSALSDPNTQNQAFAVGADDYLCKPVMGFDLANRILNRLQRIRAFVDKVC
jgi:DNA-binding response OmpR family regulator/HPt (histidine-containing phosphotransfer) domain-containing protein